MKDLLSLKLTAKTPENRWLEDDPFLLGPALLAGWLPVSYREGIYNTCINWCRISEITTTLQKSNARGGPFDEVKNTRDRAV